MHLIDSHCHFDFPDFDPDREAVLRESLRAGVLHLVIPGVQAKAWGALVRLCERHPNLWPALGLHPYFVSEHRIEHLDLLMKMLDAHGEHIVAVGEIGVDGRKPEPELQWELFRAQLDIARDYNKPVVIHSVKTHDEVYAELKRRDLSRKGVIHAFSGSRQQAEHFVEVGFRLGIGGVITHERSRKTREAIRHIPTEMLVLESDAPDMAMANHKGQRNSPQWLPEVLIALAELKNESPEALASVLWRNACELYGYEFPKEPAKAIGRVTENAF